MWIAGVCDLKDLASTESESGRVCAIAQHPRDRIWGELLADQPSPTLASAFLKAEANWEFHAGLLTRSADIAAMFLIDGSLFQMPETLPSSGRILSKQPDSQE